MLIMDKNLEGGLNSNVIMFDLDFQKGTSCA